MDAFESLLIYLAKHRGLILTDDVARYLTRRLRQTPTERRRNWQIERSSLIEQRTPTIPFENTGVVVLLTGLLGLGVVLTAQEVTSGTASSCSSSADTVSIVRLGYGAESYQGARLWL